MERYDAVIIGAGPAGLFSAVHAAAKGSKVLVAEKNGTAAKKLFLTGSGRCNITHAGPVDDFPIHYGERGTFVKPALLGFTNADLVRFFETRRLAMIEEEDGRVFPGTYDPGDVLRVLLEECSAKGILLRLGEPVVLIRRTDNDFTVRTARAEYVSRAVVIATGGRSYPKTGSSGDGYRFARDLGHAVTETAPALTPLIARNHRFGGCAGISLRGATVTVRRDGRPVRRTRGDVLFTHGGLSGPAVLDLSGQLRRGDVVTVSLVDFASAREFDESLAHGAASRGRRSLKSCLAAYGIPGRLVARILELCGVPPTLRTANLDRETRRLIVERVTALPFTVERLGGWDEAMVTRGGVSVGEIRRTTMESRLVPRLYFAGEVMDVDGDTGGYNLQFAFSSGALAGGSLGRLLAD